MELEKLDPAVFENLIFDLACDCGLINPKWRTPGSDEGRDIEGEFYISDLSGYYQRQLWYIECKKYIGSVGWPLVWEKISYAETHSADVLLFTNTSTITPQAQNQVTKWNESGKRPAIRVWNKIDIVERLNVRKSIAIKYGLIISTLQEAAASLAPLLKLLIKSNDSLYSSGLQHIKAKSKLELSHALGELIDKRLGDLEQTGTVTWRKTDAGVDLYDWVTPQPPSTIIDFDNLGLRAFLCYIKLCTRSDFIALNLAAEDVKEIELKISEDIEEYQIEHLRTICNWSDFSFTIDEESITLHKAEL